MNRVIILLIASLWWASLAAGADTLVFPSKNGNVAFNHKKHNDMLRECRFCHDKSPGRIAGFGKDFAHKTCKGCHELRGAGPTKCGLCHKK
ncbi:cytochrome c7 [Geobacter pickeringii]|uniref:Cytochrome C n=1 Tax=Geobacter pickeringii TaxID=345632 RepID=A0A0B5BE11_9BACT|nr:cytochrome c7 [Geobacter pickeringii]AJE03364.1 cytochrome C [Geobacter pickeringii]